MRIEADVFYEKPDAKYEKDVTENQFILPLTRVDNGFFFVCKVAVIYSNSTDHFGSFFYFSPANFTGRAGVL